MAKYQQMLFQLISKSFVWLSAITLSLLSFQTVLASPAYNKRAGVVPSLTGAATSIGAGTYPRAMYLADGSTLR
jgi:hypothetical protein